MSQELASYTFLPWLRQGIVSKITQQDNLGVGEGVTLRNSVHVALQVNSDTNFASQEVELISAGDVIGINSRAIVRTEPRNWITDFEPNYLACIEFYDESFLWAYTPAKAVEVNTVGENSEDAQDTKLRPWLYLLVLEDNEFDSIKSADGLLPSIRLKDTLNTDEVFPPAGQSWAWAHVHVSEDITDENNNDVTSSVTKLEDLISKSPDSALSRLVCPRKLKPRTSYHSFVVPAFEVGRLVGLGMNNDDGDILAASWGAGQKDYPVYYEWNFSTGDRGDFEYLVNLLEGRVVDERVGIRDMDMQVGSFGVDGMSDKTGDLPVMGLEGALKSPQAVSRPSAWPPVNIGDRPEFSIDLVDQINLQDTYLEPIVEGTEHPDPVISPPIYGRWHAKQKRISIGESGWVDDLNQDPRHRVSAGIGTQVVQDKQENYIQKSWQQLGDVLRANQKIRQGQMAIATTYQIYVKNILPLNSTAIVTYMPTFLRRVMGSPTTLFHQLRESRLPQAAVSSTLRMILRPRGKLAGKILPAADKKLETILNKLNDGIITAAPPKKVSEELISLNNLVDKITPAWLPEWIQQLFLKKYVRWILIVLLVLSIAFVAVIGIAAISTSHHLPTIAKIVAIGIIPLATTFVYSERLLKQLKTVERLNENNITKETTERNPPRPNFKVTEPNQIISPSLLKKGSSDSLDAKNFRSALLGLNERLETPHPIPAEKKILDIKNASSKLRIATNPVTTIPHRILSYMSLPKNIKYRQHYETIAPIMAHPNISDPMYKPMLDISSELLVPNLNLIENNTITLLETNSVFIESYMVGLNHEMASELLWREYPTDQRGSYFRQFWDVSEVINRDETADDKILEESLLDIKPIHTWSKESELGSHNNRSIPTGGKAEDSKLVLAIRGDLLKKYPTAIIFAQKAKWVDELDENDVLVSPPRKIRVLDESEPGSNTKYPIFKAHIDPDVRFIGFDITAKEAQGNPNPPESADDVGKPGWFFCIQERPGEPRFGLDIQQESVVDPVAIDTWNKLSWNHFGDPDTIKIIDLDSDFQPEISIEAPENNIKWASNSADMAYILYQAPVMVALHADDMLD